MPVNVKREPKFPGLMDDLNPTSEHTHTQTHKPTQRVKEYKQHRVQMLFKPSMIEELDQYAKNYNVSRTEIVQALVSEFLSDPLLRSKVEARIFKD